jgi:hypothetical protein
VPAAAYQKANVPPYSGTVTFSLDRKAPFNDPVTLSVDPALVPPGLKVEFVAATVAPGLGSAVLSVQAGYPDPADPTFTTQVYPALGTYSIPITASAPGAVSATGVLTLALVPEPVAFGLSFFNAERQPQILTSLDLTPVVPLDLPIMPFWTRGLSTAIGPVTLALAEVPAGLGVTIDGLETPLAVNLNDMHNLHIEAQPGLQAGTYAFQVSATFLKVTQHLPVVVTFSPAAFAIRPPLASTATLAQGRSLTFPLHLWRRGTFFAPQPTGDPAYVGDTHLSVAGALPSGLAVTFPDPDPTGLASAPLVITAGASLAPGDYPVTLLATRQGVDAPLTLTVRVTSPLAAPTIWVQAAEWGQSVVAPDLRLVGGKAALLRIHLLADRPGVRAPGFQAVLLDALGATSATVELKGPTEVPMRVLEGDLPVSQAPSGSTYTAILPAGNVQPGMRVLVQPATAGAFTARTLSPDVVPGSNLNLTLVPVIHRGVAPVLPSDTVMVQGLTAMWPITGVNLAHRAPYTTSTVLPQPADPENLAGWSQLLSELASLRIVDGQSANYYGFLNPGITSRFKFAITGISRMGDGVGLGIDEAAAPLFQIVDSSLGLATRVMLHEEGHAFNLNHAPAGGAGNPQLNYPYAQAVIGTWGYDPASGTVFDAGQDTDLMCYDKNIHWISDWNYRNVMGFLEVTAMAAQAPAASADQWVISGWLDPEGGVHLLPLLQVACVPAPPVPGDLTLVLGSGPAALQIPFAAAPLQDAPEGHRHFSFTVPAGASAADLEIRVPGGHPFRRARMPVARAVDGLVTVEERDGVAHLAWDAALHPCLSVFHEGAHRTALALYLTGGSADLPLEGLPKGGRFVFHPSPAE